MVSKDGIGWMESGWMVDRWSVIRMVRFDLVRSGFDFQYEVVLSFL